MARQTAEERALEEKRQAETEQAERVGEAKRFGRARFSRILSSDLPTTTREFDVEVPRKDGGSELVEGWVKIRQLSEAKLKRWQNAGQEIYAREDEDARSGQKFQVVRDLSEEDILLMEMAILDFSIPTRKRLTDGLPAVKRKEHMGDGMIRALYEDLMGDEDGATGGIYQYIVDACREVNGLAVKNDVGAEPSTTSSALSNENTAP